ncbi:MAG: hypothetical protein AAB375_01770 [Patescibacteria group bacterium]
MNILEFKPAKKDSDKVVDIADIENMSEQTVSEIRAKKQAFNDLILSLDGQINMVHSESGSNSPDDDSQEQAQDSQDLSLIANLMDRARSEMVRLGDKEEIKLQEAA